MTEIMGPLLTERASRRLVWRALAPAAVMLTIFYFSSPPLTDPGLAWWEVLVRKLGHVTGYALLTASWWWALGPLLRRPWPIGTAIALSLIYACTDEYHQGFVDGRHAAPLDVAIDAVGIALSAAIIARKGPQTFGSQGPGGR